MHEEESVYDLVYDFKPRYSDDAGYPDFNQVYVDIYSFDDIWIRSEYKMITGQWKVEVHKYSEELNWKMIYKYGDNFDFSLKLAGEELLTSDDDWNSLLHNTGASPATAHPSSYAGLAVLGLAVAAVCLRKRSTDSISDDFQRV